MIIKSKSKAKQQIEKIADRELTFGRMLKSLRECEGVSQEVYVKKLGVSKQYLSAIENGRKHISLIQAKRFAKILGHSEVYFVQFVLQDVSDQAGLNVQVKLVNYHKNHNNMDYTELGGV